MQVWPQLSVPPWPSRVARVRWVSGMAEVLATAAKRVRRRGLMKCILLMFLFLLLLLLLFLVELT